MKSGFTAGSGLSHPVRSWLPEGETLAVMAALHGFTDYSHAFATPGPLLASKGIALHAFDQRGHGEGPLRGSWAGADAMAGDASDFLDHLAAGHPGVPLFLLGESMGGAVALLARRNRADLAGTVLVAPAVWGGPAMHPVRRAVVSMASRLLPFVRIDPDLGPGEGSDNAGMLAAFFADPAVLRRVSFSMLGGLVELMGKATVLAPELGADVLILQGGKDNVVSSGAVSWFNARLRKEAEGGPALRHYPDSWHMMLRDRAGDAVTADIAGWILARSGQVPATCD
jgi:alpha-beta hydrolase superfamily lysophospholipase